ncbi:hypothetical protein JR316_0004870 [Psilocybe cubensis]|uniref:Uncharacterized protein n=2 Tax=Psilocybe cubensis TaxID=181762 RepID=A0A8H7XX60_PSICU|nr:hypothetical protein JR316_0004870 [Psilocybe cubensis]KAH9482770.1 hypothetical protein JR316_0004870 [Psilocybe cubensis]
MQRPGPLQELPLERFLPSHPSTQPAAVKPIRSNKRPLSPGGPSLFSPTKRRILNDEGVYSPDKTCKIPLPSLSSSPARFSRVLAGPASPARVLDFGLPQHVYGDPQKPTISRISSIEIMAVETSSSSTHLASSPELKVRKAKPTQRPPSAGLPSDFDNNGHEQDIFGTGPSAAFSQFIARELPPQPDLDSVHYPGFRVFQDPYVTVFRTTEEEDLRSACIVEVDAQKENLPPRRKPRKVETDLKAAQDLSHCDTTTPKKMNQTPKRMESWGSAELSSTIARNMFRISTPSTTSRQGQKSPLQMMKDEMDVVDDDSSDE